MVKAELDRFRHVGSVIGNVASGGHCRQLIFSLYLAKNCVDKNCVISVGM